MSIAMLNEIACFVRNFLNSIGIDNNVGKIIYIYFIENL